MKIKSGNEIKIPTPQTAPGEKNLTGSKNKKSCAKQPRDKSAISAESKKTDPLKSRNSSIVQWVNGHQILPERREARSGLSAKDEKDDLGGNMVQWINGHMVDLTKPLPEKQEKPRKPMTGTVSYTLGKSGKKSEMVQWLNGAPLTPEPEQESGREENPSMVQWVAGKPLTRSKKQPTETEA